MKKNNKKHNLDDAVAFEIAFQFMIYTYGSVGWDQFERSICSRCGKYEQFGDYLAPKSSCKKDYGMLQNFRYGISEKIRNELIDNFEINENDFRPIRNLTGDIVYYQITPQHTMLPISSVNRIRQLKPCKKCGSFEHRIKEYKDENDNNFYYITKEVLDDMHDINQTFENFDMWIPMYIVSRRVYDYLIAKYPRMHFFPIYLKEE